MRKINHEELSALLRAQLKPGVTANTALTDYRGEEVWAEEHPGALLLFLEREGYYQLNFFLQRGAAFPKIQAKAPVVTEFASKTGAFLAIQNGRLLFSRQRLCRSPGPAPAGPAPVRAATTADFAACKDLLLAHFDRYAGCLPTDAQLQKDLLAGQIYFSEAGGILHTRPARQGTEIRHLAVAEGARKKGVAQSLFHLYMREHPGKTCRVWVRMGNAPAEAFYRKNGFAPDGITTRIYLFEECAP